MNLQSQEEFLAKCTVRIQAVGKSGYGTGFFVAPGLILTCAHVIRKNGQILKQVKFYWPEKEYQAEVDQVPEDNKNIDIALLKVNNLVNEEFVLSLVDDPFATGDELYTFGYPDNNFNGEPGTFEIIGLTGDKPPLMKFKEGQVRPGFSGAPLLNLRTGKVCGIINKTRDRSSDLGGKGVPASVIFENFPELKPTVISSNPFIPIKGRIDNSEFFFNRNKEVNKIFELLNTNHNVVLVGDRQIGKSSLLKAIHREAKNKLQKHRQPVYLDLGCIRNDEEFCSYLCDEIGIPNSSGYQLTRKIKGQKILLAMDRIEILNWRDFTLPIFYQIASWAEGFDAPMRLVIAANKFLDEIFIDNGMTSTFEGICINEQICSWDQDTCHNFIKHRLQFTNVNFLEDDIKNIILESQGHPQKLTEICYKKYEIYIKKIKQ